MKLTRSGMWVKTDDIAGVLAGYIALEIGEYDHLGGLSEEGRRAIYARRFRLQQRCLDMLRGQLGLIKAGGRLDGNNPVHALIAEVVSELDG